MERPPAPLSRCLISGLPLICDSLRGVARETWYLASSLRRLLITVLCLASWDLNVTRGWPQRGAVNPSAAVTLWDVPNQSSTSTLSVTLW